MVNMKVKDFVKPWVFGLEKYVPGEFREGFIKLASNENNYGPSPKVIAAIKDAAGKSYIYPYLDNEIRRKAANYAGFSEDSVMVGNGSDELMELVLKTFEGPVASFYPSYASYRIFPRMLGMDYYEIGLGKDFSFNVDDFIRKAKSSRICFVGSPNNPTGTVIEEEDLVKLLGEDKIVVLDEAYYEFAGKSHVKLTKDFKNLIVLRTLSKAFGIGGLRVGYAIGDPETIGFVSSMKPPFSIASVSEVAAMAALDDLKYMRDCVGKIVRDREMMYKKLGDSFKVYPSKSNFLLVDVSPMTAEDFFNKMLKQKIIVRKFGRFRGFEGNYVRITVGTEKENKKLLEAVEETR
jgi:histidinol-phosphate aminotransferase